MGRIVRGLLQLYIFVFALSLASSSVATKLQEESHRGLALVQKHFKALQSSEGRAATAVVPVQLRAQKIGDDAEVELPVQRDLYQLNKPSLVRRIGTNIASINHGELRTLLSKTVTDSFLKYVPANDVHMAVVGDIDDAMQERVYAVYRPVSFRVVNESLACAEKDDTQFKTRMPCQPQEWPGCRMLIAWESMRDGYADVEASERKRGKPYAWILRLRTDIVFFDYLRIERLNPRFVHLPTSDAMNKAEYARFTNDHFFACPRDLCYPYFSLLDLWESPLCDPTGNAPPGIFGKVDHETGTLTPNVIPTKAYSIPIVPPGVKFTEWYILARYSKDGACLPDDGVSMDQDTCGLIHEFELLYALKSGGELIDRMRCHPLERMVNQSDRHTKSKRRLEDALKDCQEIDQAESESS